VLAFPVLFFHPKLREGKKLRLGFYPPGFALGKGSPRIWLHGASAGDLLSLQPMMAELKARMPGCCIIATSMTGSGFAIARERIPEADVVSYVPWDLPGATRRAVATLRPDLLVLEYTEIWPNLIRAAHRAGVKIALTNGRFDAEKLPRYRALFRLIGNPLRALDLFLMRTDDEAERALALGAPVDRVWVTGNTKFDALVLPRPDEPDAALRAALGLPEGAPVLMAGSTHDGEEELLFGVYRALLGSFPDLRLVVAPRYVERVPRVLALAAERGLTARTRTAGSGPAQVAVLDTIGELRGAYRLATVVFVGGSFVSRGGQNILEPAAQAKPVLFGPHMENFKDSVQTLVGRGGIQVNGPEQLVKVAHDLLERPAKIAELGALARQAVLSIRGASARNVDHLLTLLGVARAA
jgi:3-deoxy-D-manno-octulosonic-acid transferase